MANILLVEDNPHNRLVFQTTLVSRGHTLRVAEDGEQALAMVREDPPELMLLDLSLPKVDGWSVAKAMRTDGDDRVRTVPILALTAHAMKGDRDRALEAGCNGYLSKPVSPRELARTVSRMLSASSAAA